MDIQRGDQVYYRGEVWTVIHVADPMWGGDTVTVDRPGTVHGGKPVTVRPDEVQRVEQVR